MSNSEPLPSGLVMIARDATGQIVTRITSHRDLVGILHTARCVLRLKVGAVRVEVHRYEAPNSTYAGQPLAAMSLDDLSIEQAR
jgi:hypothetical protein